MARSRLLRGVPVPRSRAQTRRREAIGSVAEEESALDALTAWMSEGIEEDLAREAMQAFDVTAFLRDTAQFELPPAERVRRLAIFFEEERFDPDGWLALQRLYDHAAKLDPSDVLVLASNAASAIFFAEIFDPPESSDLIGKAKTLLQRAREKDPRNAHVLYLTGYCEYMDPAGSIPDALTWLEQACENDSTDAWAHLYRAHCLHDLERWREAAEAYEAVNGSAFKGPVAWRAEKLREQLASCRLHSGDEVGALNDFERILKIYEQLPPDRIIDMSDLIEAASGVFRKQLAERVAALAERIGLDDDARQLREVS